VIDLERGTDMRRHQAIHALLLAIALIGTACSGGENGSGGDASSAATPSEAAEPPATPSAEAAPTEPAPFLLDLETGEERPLVESLAGGFGYAVSPDGTRLAYEIGGCEAGSVVKVANLDGTDVSTLESPEGLAICAGVRWSPDGTGLLYQVRDPASHDLGNLFVHDLASGERTQITDLELVTAYWWFLTATFSHDGRSVLYHLPRSSSQVTKWDVWSVPVTGGEPRLVVRNASFPMALANGEIAFVVPMDSTFSGQRIAIADGAGSPRTLVEAEDTWWPTISPDGARIAYPDGGSIYVVDVSTGESTMVADGGLADWLDDDTLIVSP
jgi:Tol biopolymer transport system component